MDFGSLTTRGQISRPLLVKPPKKCNVLTIKGSLHTVNPHSARSYHTQTVHTTPKAFLPHPSIPATSCMSKALSIKDKEEHDWL